MSALLLFRRFAVVLTISLAVWAALILVPALLIGWRP